MHQQGSSSLAKRKLLWSHKPYNFEICYLDLKAAYKIEFFQHAYIGCYIHTWTLVFNIETLLSFVLFFLKQITELVVLF